MILKQSVVVHVGYPFESLKTLVVPSPPPRGTRWVRASCAIRPYTIGHGAIGESRTLNPCGHRFLVCDVYQFQHDGIEIKSLLGSHAPTSIHKCTPLVLGTYACDFLHAFSFSATIEHMPSTSAPGFSCQFKLILQTNARGRFERPPELEFYQLSQL